MTDRPLKLLAFALLFFGAIEMISQAWSQDTVLLPTCLGNTIEITVSAGEWSALHCWGCYSLVAGIGLISFLTAKKYLRKEKTVSRAL